MTRMRCCVPFCKRTTGKTEYAEWICGHVPTIVCERVHGARPSRQHLAVVTCAGRTRGCCNPRHVRWMTKSEEFLRHYQKTPCTNTNGNKPKLSPDQITAIAAAKADGVGPSEISRRLNIHLSTVFYWTGTRQRLGNHIGPITRRRLAGILPASAGLYIPARQGWRDLVADINAIVPIGLVGREDVCQEIALEIMEGRASLDSIRAQGYRRFMTKVAAMNFEKSGYGTVSFDAPIVGGLSLHDVMRAGE